MKCLGCMQCWCRCSFASVLSTCDPCILANLTWSKKNKVMGLWSVWAVVVVLSIDVIWCRISLFILWLWAWKELKLFGGESVLCLWCIIVHGAFDLLEEQSQYWCPILVDLLAIILSHTVSKYPDCCHCCNFDCAHGICYKPCLLGVPPRFTVCCLQTHGGNLYLPCEFKLCSVEPP